MGTRYQDSNISLCLNKASLLDPRFKTLSHLSQNQLEEVIESIPDKLLLYKSIKYILKKNKMTVMSLMTMIQSQK